MDFSIIKKFYRKVPTTVIAAMLCTTKEVPVYAAPLEFTIRSISYKLSASMMVFEFSKRMDDNSEIMYTAMYSPSQSTLTVSSKGVVYTELELDIAEYVYSAITAFQSSVASVITMMGVITKGDPSVMIHEKVALAMLDAFEDGVGELILDSEDAVGMARTMDSSKAEYLFTECFHGKVTVYSYVPSEHFYDLQHQYTRDFFHVNVIKKIIATRLDHELLIRV